MLELEVAGQKVSTNSMTYRQHGLGRRKSFPRSPFTLTVDASGFKERALPIYLDLIKELERDDAIMGAFDPPYEGALRHPSFDELLVLPTPLKMQLVNVHLAWDFLGLYLIEENPDAACEWLVVNALEDVSELDGHIIIQGYVVPLTPPQGHVASAE